MAGTAGRVLEMDAVRGVAMLGVFIAHSAQYLAPGRYPALDTVLVTLGMFATPTFLLLSGIISGYLRDSGLRDAHQYRITLLGRGLFLLTVGHVVLGLTHWIWMPFSHAMWQSVFITDAVGVGLVLAAHLPRHCSRNLLLGAGAALLAISWVATLILSPSDAVELYATRVLAGLNADTGELIGSIVPVIPYLGIFLIGMAGGVEHAHREARGMQLSEVAKFCIRLGVAGMALGCLAKLAWLGARPHVAMAAQPVMQFLTEPRNKIPPGPAYVTLFGSCGVLVAGIIALRLRALRLPTRIAATLGQASFVIFVLQYWLIWAPGGGFGLRGGLLFWIASLCLASAALIAAAAIANRMHFNRLLTFKRLLAKH